MLSLVQLGYVELSTLSLVLLSWVELRYVELCLVKHFEQVKRRNIKNE